MKTQTKQVDAQNALLQNKLFKTVFEDVESQDDPESYVKDVLEHGCVSGTVLSLIDYGQTNDFYDKFKEEIWDLLDEQSKDQRTTILQFISNLQGAKEVGGDATLKNLLAWFAYEESVRKIAQEIYGKKSTKWRCEK